MLTWGGRFLFVFILLFSNWSHAYFPSDESIVLHRIAFGSCNFQRKSQSHWDLILDQKPDLWIWLGDNIYADPLPPFLRAREYKALKQDPYYSRFEQEVPVIGTWDDHDFGFNNTGKNYWFKKSSQQLHLNFLNEPQNSPRRIQEGIYTSFRYGPSGRVVRVIVLDTRYFRDSTGFDHDLLGDAQWKWLSKELIENSGDVALTFILSSSQVISTRHSKDSWGEYPLARELLLSLINQSGSKTIILSGDRHHNEASMLTLPNGQALWDLTSSGLTHGAVTSDEENPNRMGQVLYDKNFGFLTLDWSKPTLEVFYETWDIGKEEVAQRIDLTTGRVELFGLLKCKDALEKR